MSDEKTTFKIGHHRISKSNRMLKDMIDAFSTYFIQVSLVDKVKIEVFDHGDFSRVENEILKQAINKYITDETVKKIIESDIEMARYHFEQKGVI